MNPINMLFEDDFVLNLLRLTTGCKSSGSSEEERIALLSDFLATGE